MRCNSNPWAYMIWCELCYQKEAAGWSITNDRWSSVGPGNFYLLGPPSRGGHGNIFSATFASSNILRVECGREWGRLGKLPCPVSIHCLRLTVLVAASQLVCKFCVSPSAIWHPAGTLDDLSVYIYRQCLNTRTCTVYVSTCTNLMAVKYFHMKLQSLKFENIPKLTKRRPVRCLIKTCIMARSTLINCGVKIHAL